MNVTEGNDMALFSSLTVGQKNALLIEREKNVQEKEKEVTRRAEIDRLKTVEMEREKTAQEKEVTRRAEIDNLGI